MTERFICDDAGSLIDMEERKYYDIVEEVCPVLNELHEENKELKSLCKVLITHIDEKSIAFVIDEDVRRLLE
jgi:hypothetical protein